MRIKTGNKRRKRKLMREVVRRRINTILKDATLENCVDKMLEAINAGLRPRGLQLVETRPAELAVTLSFSSILYNETGHLKSIKPIEPHLSMEEVAGFLSAALGKPETTAETTEKGTVYTHTFKSGK